MKLALLLIYLIGEGISMKINWKARLRYKPFLVAMFALLLLIIQQVAAVFGIDTTVYNELVTELFNAVLGILVVLGIVVDPTTSDPSDNSKAGEKMVKVAWCAGHGGYVDKAKKIDAKSGKRTPDGELEWEFNDIVGRAFAKELALYEGVVTKRYDDPTGKTDVPLITRTNGANSWGADYYISFHQNAYQSVWGNHSGLETYIAPNASAESRKLAEVLQAAQLRVYGLRDLGIKTENFHIVRETKMPAALVEGPFMDSVIDIKILRNKLKLEEAGREMAKAFASWKGLKRTTNTNEGPKESEEIMLNATGRTEIRALLKKAREKGIIDAEVHTDEKISKYTDVQLLSYQAAVVNRTYN